MHMKGLSAAKTRQAPTIRLLFLYHTLSQPKGKIRPADMLQLKGATILPLVVLLDMHPLIKEHSPESDLSSVELLTSDEHSA